MLGIKDALKEVLDKSNNLDRDISNLAYRRDLDTAGRQAAQNALVQSIQDMKDVTPVNVKVTDSKTFVKYIKDPDLKNLLTDFTRIKNINLNANAFLESTKSIQSKAIVSTKVRNVVLYYPDSSSKEITLVTKDIAVPKAEDDAELKNSNTASFVEVIPKTILQDAGIINFITKDYDILKSDPLIEFPPTTRQITYFINKSINPSDFEQADTVLIDKNIYTVTAATGFSILGVDSTNISMDGKTIMIMIVVVLVLAFIIINFGVIGKISDFFHNDKKKISYIRVLVNDATDMLSVADYEKASLIYREVKLNYESSTASVQKQVFDECYELCNKLDLFYFNELFTETEELIQSNSVSRSIENYDKLEKTFNKMDDNYRKDLYKRLESLFEKVERLRS